MSHYIDPRPGWVRQRTFELQKTGMSYDAANRQAEDEADEKFGAEEGDGDDENGNGGSA